MGKLKPLFLCIILFCAPSVFASLDGVPVHLENANVDVKDLESVKRGGKFFAQYCMLCHSVKYLRHDALAHSLGIVLEKMPLKDQEWWFGVAPPDLSLEARIRSPEWIYTYLHSFYKDESRNVGSNNLVFDNSSMPNPFAGMQGEQVLSLPKEKIHSLHGIFSGKPYYYEVLRMEKQGSMTPEEFDQNTRDVVNFLVYASDPNKMDRMSLGFWVLGFLFILLIISFLLKKEYWRHIK